MDIKKRIEKLERRVSAGEVVILLDEIDGQLYKDGKKTTIAKERESNKEAVIFIDNIPKGKIADEHTATY